MDPNATLEKIIEQLFCKEGDYDRALELIEALAEWIAKGGFYPDCPIMNWDEILIGAYWYCHDYHNGQWSDEYRLMGIIRKVYTPSVYTTGPEKGTNETSVYETLETLAQQTV